MTIASLLFSFPSLALASVVEAALALRFFPEHWGPNGHLKAIGTLLAINHVFRVLFWTLLYPKLFSPLRRIPGPKALFSDTYRSMVVKEGAAGDLFLDIIKKYPGEDLVALDALGRQFLVARPRLLADILVHKCYNFAKPRRISSFLRRILGQGLITVEEDQHKFLRKNTMPAFHMRHIKDLYPMMWDKASILTRTLNRGVDNAGGKGVVVELTTWASKVTLDIIGIAGMGHALNTVEKASDPLQDTFEELLEPNREKVLFGMLSFAIGYPVVRLLPWKMNQTFLRVVSTLDRICKERITEKRNAIEKGAEDHFDILSLLIKSNNFDDDALRDQLLTFLAAGHETTASAFTWASYLLAKHPNYQTKLYEEVIAALGTHPTANPEPPSNLAETLRSLPYLNGIINETLRLYPTVPLTIRQSLCDTQVGEHFIPKGTEMVVSIWQINRSPEIWGPEAATFKPERWINVDEWKVNRHGGAKSNYDFMTFLEGPRSCIGQEFARAEMRCLLAALVTWFTWDLAMEERRIAPKGVITIKPENGMHLRLTPRL